MQITTTMRYQLTPIKMMAIKKKKDGFNLKKKKTETNK